MTAERERTRRLRLLRGYGPVVEHDLSLIASVCDELVAPDQVLNHPRVVAFYLGQARETAARA